MGAAIFFGVPWIAGKLAIGAAGKASLAGASWWKSTLGIGAQAGAGAGAAATTTGTAAAAAPSSFSAAAAGGASAQGASFGTGIGSMAGNASAVQGAATVGSAGGGTIGTLGAGAGTATNTISSAAAGGASAGTAATNTGLLARAGGAVKGLWGGLGDTGRAAAITMGGNMLSGAAKAKAERQAIEDEQRREDELKARESIYGVRHDGSNVDQAYDPASMMPDYSQGFRPGLLSQGPPVRPEWLAANPAMLHFV